MMEILLAVLIVLGGSILFVYLLFPVFAYVFLALIISFLKGAQYLVYSVKYCKRVFVKFFTKTLLQYSDKINNCVDQLLYFCVLACLISCYFFVLFVIGQWTFGVFFWVVANVTGPVMAWVGL